MQFDLTKFLTFMLESFLACRVDDASLTPRSAIALNRAVNRAAKRALRKQAREQGANRRERREFISQHLSSALSAVEKEVAKL